MVDSLPRTIQGPPFAQTPALEGVINLGLGQPSPGLLPLPALAEAAARTLGAGSDPLLLQYGFMRGYAGVREALAAFLTREYRYPVAPEELMITGGNSMALSFASQVFARAGGRVVCEDPTYFLAHGILANPGQGLEVVGVPVDDEGLDLDALEQLLAEGPVEFVYCIPNFHNPTGVCLSPDRAARLVALAQRHDFVILADEPYGMLYHGEAPPPCMVSHERGEARVLSLGSFSKILGPGLRLGWVHGHPDLIARMASHGSVRSGGGLNPVISALVHDTLESGFLTEHVAGLRATFASRAAALTRALREHLPRARFLEPTGGYFVWLDLEPELREVEASVGVGTAAWTAALSAARVQCTQGSRCAVTRELDGHVRLCFAFYEEDELEEGVRRLARAIDDLR